MTSLVEENGSNTMDNMAPTEPTGNAPGSLNPPPTGLASTIVQILPSQTSSHQAHSVIQSNQQSVIQTAANIQPMSLPKNVLLVSKPGSVIHATQGSMPIHAVQSKHFFHQIKQEQSLSSGVMQDTSDDSITDEESPKKRRDLLVRRPSYRKILNDLGGGEIVLPGGTIQLTNSQGEPPALHTLTSPSGASTLVQYTQGQDGQPIFVPDQSRKREMRLLKNREAARECRRKKKEYIKCLENRVAVLENQNKALIEELKSLKELYCQTKSE